MRNRRLLIAGIVLPLMLGILSLTRVIGQDRFAGYYKPDVVQLVASGMCFGAALVGFFSWMRMRRGGSE